MKDEVAKWLNAQPDISWYPAQDRYQKGVSDCIIDCRGYFIAAELKADDGTATPHQNLFIEAHKRVRGIGGVCYTLQDVKKLVQEARDRDNKGGG